jgi:5'-methylthioadenosine phosphorylase
VSAVGSLKQEHKPMDFLIPDQFIDRTKQRVSTFFGDGLVAHVALADPVCSEVAATASKACKKAGVASKLGGTYICIEGPQFSTRAESNLYRSWGVDVIGMTNLQEAKLAREAEICYATVAMVTDYDCWHPEHDSVTVDVVISYLNRNADNACRVLRETVAQMPKTRSCKCGSALEFAILTDRTKIPPATRKKLTLLLDKYLKAQEAGA